MKRLTDWLLESKIKFNNNNKILINNFLEELERNHFEMGNGNDKEKGSLHVTYVNYSLVYIKFKEDKQEFKVEKPHTGMNNDKSYMIQKIITNFNVPEEITTLSISKENLDNLISFILNTRKELIKNERYLDILMNSFEISEQDNNINYNEIKGLHDTEKIILQKIRKGQALFRKGILDNNVCCKLCGLKNRELLIASHIRPWKDSNDDERIDPNNGLLLCPNHDKLFDKGYISFDNNGNILISENIDTKQLELMGITGKEKIEMSELTRKHMAYHRSMVFK